MARSTILDNLTAHLERDTQKTRTEQNWGEKSAKESSERDSEAYQCKIKTKKEPKAKQRPSKVH